MIETANNSLRTDAISFSRDSQESTLLASRNRLCRRLERGPDTRAKFVESHLNKGLAYQLRAMREARGLSQEELAQLVDMPQTAISRLESPDYGKQTITTLKRLAKVHDVALVVRFVPFSKLVDWVSGTPYLENGLSSNAMAVPSFEQEARCGRFDYAANTAIPVIHMQTPPLKVTAYGKFGGFAMATEDVTIEAWESIQSGVILGNYGIKIKNVGIINPANAFPPVENTLETNKPETNKIIRYQQTLEPKNAYAC